MVNPDQTIALWRASKFVWGETDCIMATCNYIRDATGIDPARPWRGTYSTETGAQAILDAHGGVLGLFTHGMALAGFQQGSETIGSPVVCQMPGAQVAGISLGRWVAFMAVGHGMVEMRAEVLSAWAI